MSDAKPRRTTPRSGLVAVCAFVVGGMTAVQAEVAVLDGDPESAEEGATAAFRADLHEVGDGLWVLHGTAPSLEEKREAVRAVERSNPDADVLDRLRVIDPDLLAGATANDDELGVAVRLRLGEEKLGNVGVASVHAGTVLLRGTAETDAERRAAVRVASEVPGVEAVYDDAITAGDTRSEPARSADAEVPAEPAPADEPEL